MIEGDELLARRFATITKGALTPQPQEEERVCSETSTMSMIPSPIIRVPVDSVQTTTVHTTPVLALETISEAAHVTSDEEKEEIAESPNSPVLEDITAEANNSEINETERDADNSISKQPIPDSILRKAKILSLSDGGEIYVSYWDLGGEEIYYATHHIHLSPDAVYVCVFDVSQMQTEEFRLQQLGKYALQYNY